MTHRYLAVGDRIDNMTLDTSFGPDFDLDLLSGRHIAVAFMGHLNDAAGIAALERLKALPIFNGREGLLLVVLCGAKGSQSTPPKSRGVGYIFDHDLKMARHFGAVPQETHRGDAVQLRRMMFVLSPRMQIDKIFGFDRLDAAIGHMSGLQDPAQYLGFEVFAPILVIPNVFEPDLCNLLIAQYAERARAITGAMRREGDRTIEVVDAKHKVRRDYLVEDQGLLDVISNRIRVRVKPEIKKVHQFEVTRIERNLVGCYTAEDGGHFRPHRDNTTPATAHRKFALSINLNGDFDGGEVGFPEYGSRTYRAPPGGAVVFSCSLLHSVSRVTRGARYAYLPFLYDAEGSRIRAANIASYAGASFAPAAAKETA